MDNFGITSGNTLPLSAPYSMAPGEQRRRIAPSGIAKSKGSTLPPISSIEQCNRGRSAGSEFHSNRPITHPPEKHNATVSPPCRGLSSRQYRKPLRDSTRVRVPTDDDDGVMALFRISTNSARSGISVQSKVSTHETLGDLGTQDRAVGTDRQGDPFSWLVCITEIIGGATRIDL